MVFCNKSPLSILTQVFVSYLVFLQVKGFSFSCWRTNHINAMMSLKHNDRLVKCKREDISDYFIFIYAVCLWLQSVLIHCLVCTLFTNRMLHIHLDNVTCNYSFVSASMLLYVSPLKHQLEKNTTKQSKMVTLVCLM